MKIKGKILGAALLATISVSSIANVTYAATLVQENGQAYVVDWSNYDYTKGLEGSFTLEDEDGNKPTFSQNTSKEWVSPLLTVKGSIISGFEFKQLNFKFNSDDVKVFDYETNKEITNGFLKAGQKIFIVSNENPLNLRLNISPILIIEN